MPNILWGLFHLSWKYLRYDARWIHNLLFRDVVTLDNYTFSIFITQKNHLINLLVPFLITDNKQELVEKFVNEQEFLKTCHLFISFKDIEKNILYLEAVFMINQRIMGDYIQHRNLIENNVLRIIRETEGIETMDELPENNILYRW